MSNAGNEAQIERLRSREEINEKLLYESLKQVVSSVSGRVVMNWILYDICLMEADPFHADRNIQNHNLGRQSAGREIRAFIRSINPVMEKALNDQRYQEVADIASIRATTQPKNGVS